MLESRRLHWSRARCGSAVFHTLEARERTNLSRHDYTLGRACIYSLTNSSAQWGPQTPQALGMPGLESQQRALWRLTGTAVPVLTGGYNMYM